MYRSIDAAQWVGKKSERRKAGSSEDQTHMMLKFHPRYHDGSSSSTVCTDPVCSGHPTDRSKSTSKQSNPHNLSSSSIPHKCSSPKLSRTSYSAAVRSSLPSRVSNPHRKVSSLSSSRRSSSSSCHSQPASEGIHQHSATELVELMTEATIPPSPPSSSISESQDERKDSTAPFDANQTEPSDFRSENTDVQSPAGHLSSIIERDEPRPAS
ncbi:hypothetical protein Aperf_G00000002092 [Anoplocephala perfoliata]